MLYFWEEKLFRLIFLGGGGEKIFLNKFASRNQGVLSLMDNICLAEIQSAAISQAI